MPITSAQGTMNNGNLIGLPQRAVNNPKSARKSERMLCERRALSQKRMEYGIDNLSGFLAAFGDSSEEIYYMQRTPTTSERRSAALT
jgi:hypothetical protein